MNIFSNMIEAHIFREVKDDIEFFLLKRSEKVIYSGLWQMVNGKIKEGEKAYEAALREIKEETGLTPEKLWVAPLTNSFYSHEKNEIIILPVFAAKVNGKEEIILSDEHTEYKWVSFPETLTMLAWDGQRKAVTLIRNYYLKERNFLDLIEIRF